MENIKTLMPLITFFLGILLGPFTESLKDNAKAKKTYRNLMAELQDEINAMPDRLKKMAECYQTLSAVKGSNIPIGKSLRYVPRETRLYFLKSAMDLSFSMFTREQRFYLKSVVAQVGALEMYINEIRKTDVDQERIDQSIDNCKRYLYTGACFLNAMRIVSNSRRVKVFDKDEHVIESIFLEYGINISFEDILIKKTIKFQT